VALSLLGIAPRLVLLDRWFATGNLAAMIPQTTELDVIGTVKASPHVYYEFAKAHRVGQYTLNQLGCQVIWPPMAIRAILGSCRVTLATESGRPPRRIVFVRNLGARSKQWLTLWRTGVSVPEDQVVRIYGKRCLGHRDGL